MKYKLKFRKGLFWKTKMVIGHLLIKETDRMDLFLEDGSILSIGSWSKYDMVLGADWVAETKKKMEEQSGQDIKLKVREA